MEKLIKKYEKMCIEWEKKEINTFKGFISEKLSFVFVCWYVFF